MLNNMLSIPVIEFLFMTVIIIFIFVYILQQVTWMSIHRSLEWVFAIHLSAAVNSLLFIHECERVFRAVKKIDKEWFLAIRSILSIIDKNFNLSIVIDFYWFFENSAFSEKIVKNYFGGTFDNFLGNEGVLC